MKKNVVIIALGFFSLLCVCESYAGKIKSVDEYTFTDPIHKKDITVYYYAPRHPKGLLFIMHGAGRQAEGQRDYWQSFGASTKYIVLAPEFDSDNWSDNAYQFGGLRSEDSSRKPLPKEQWTYAVIERLFDDAKKRFGLLSNKYMIAGNSAGGQFVNRMAMHMPEARFEKAVAANPSTYTFLDETIRWPWGLKRTILSDEEIEKSLTREVVHIVGEYDTATNYLSITPEAMLQGENRYQRHLNFRKTVLTHCQSHNVNHKWQFMIAPKVTHSTSSVGPSMQRALLGKTVKSLKYKEE